MFLFFLNVVWALKSGGFSIVSDTLGLCHNWQDYRKFSEGLRPVYSDATQLNSTSAPIAGYFTEERRFELCRYKRAFTHACMRTGWSVIALFLYCTLSWKYSPTLRLADCPSLTAIRYNDRVSSELTDGKATGYCVLWTVYDKHKRTAVCVLCIDGVI